jgi:hypothetical protein
VTGDIRFLSVHLYYVYFWLLKFILFYILLLMKFIPFCLYYVSKYSDVTCIFLHKVFQFAVPPLWLSLTRALFFSTWFSHAHFDLHRDVPRYFIYVMLVTSDFSFICSLFVYVQRTLFQHFVPHFCVSVLFRNICISFLSIRDVGHLTSSTNISFSKLTVEIVLIQYYLSFCDDYLAYLSVSLSSAPAYLQIISIVLRSQAP